MLIENWNKIYGEHLYTNNVMYEVCKDTMTVAPQSHALRLNPVSGGNQDNKSFTIVISMLDKRIACGVYIDNQWNPIEIFDMSKLDLKRMDSFKKLISAKIQNYE